MKKNKDIKEKNDIKEKMSEILELPREIILDVPKIVLVGNNDLTIENYKGIIEYSDSLIRINTNEYMIKIQGEQLEIRTITDEEIMIKGFITCVEFIR